MQDSDLRITLMQAALLHVPFDGWSEQTFGAAVADAGIDPMLARAICPRGAVDLALCYHAFCDEAMVARLQEAETDGMRFRDRVATAVRYRLDVADKEIVRRGATLFALPQHAADGARAIWATSDLIWRALGDTSEDFNWYSKRASLSAVYGATVLFWLGDDTSASEATWAFLDRRIEDVMQFERLKAQVRDNKPLNSLLSGPLALLNRIKPPLDRSGDLPGRWSGPR